MIFLIHEVKLLHIFSPHTMDQQVSPSYHTLLMVPPSYTRKVTRIVDVIASLALYLMCPTVSFISVIIYLVFG